MWRNMATMETHSRLYGSVGVNGAPPQSGDEISRLKIAVATACERLTALSLSAARFNRYSTVGSAMFKITLISQLVLPAADHLSTSRSPSERRVSSALLLVSKPSRR